MEKRIRRLVAVLLMLVVVFVSAPTTVFADTDLMLKDKTNKLLLGETADENMKYIEGSLDAGKSLTYTIEVPKGTLYIQAFALAKFKIEIYNSKDELVKKIKVVETFGEEGSHLARGGVALSKGKYKIEISTVNEDSAIDVSGTVSMIKNDTSKTITFKKMYHTAVTKGKTYKIKFKAKEEANYSFENNIVSFDPNDFIPYVQEFKVVNSAGKTLKKYDEFNQVSELKLKKGTYTIILKASKSGYLCTEVKFKKDEILDPRDWM